MVSTKPAILLILAPICIFFLYLSIGKYPVPLDHILWFERGSSYEQTILFNIRVPRAIMAAVFGAVMGIGGATLQTTLRNPLVSPYILGISAGAACGAAIGYTLPVNSSFPVIQILAAAGGVGAALIGIYVGNVRGTMSPVGIILGGIIISAFFSGILSLVQILVEPEKTQNIVSWIIGRLNLITWADLTFTVPIGIVCIILLLIFRWRIFLLSIGEDEARTSGIPVERDRLLILLIVCIGTSVVVAVCGIIGWVCLLSPHISRSLFGSSPGILLPASVSVGICFMLIADLVSRTIWVFEIPVGVITTLIGAPFFLYLMRRSLYAWGG